MAARRPSATSDAAVDLLIVGGGPCGLATAISAQRVGLSALVLEAEAVVSTIAHYPTYVKFFSTAEKLSLGGVPFVVATDIKRRPVRKFTETDAAADTARNAAPINLPFAVTSCFWSEASRARCVLT